MSGTPAKPLPVVDGDSRPFWEGARNGRLRLQRCLDCERYIFYPRAVCPHCMSENLEWRDASGRGTVYSYTVVHRAPAAFADEVPYVVALIDLAEGPRMMSRIVDCPIEDVKIGMPVQVKFRRVSDDIALPVFSPIRTD